MRGRKRRDGSRQMAMRQYYWSRALEMTSHRLAAQSQGGIFFY